MMRPHKFASGLPLGINHGSNTTSGGAIDGDDGRSRRHDPSITGDAECAATIKSNPTPPQHEEAK